MQYEHDRLTMKGATEYILKGEDNMTVKQIETPSELALALKIIKERTEIELREHVSDMSIVNYDLSGEQDFELKVRRTIEAGKNLERLRTDQLVLYKASKVIARYL